MIHRCLGFLRQMQTVAQQCFPKNGGTVHTLGSARGSIKVSNALTEALSSCGFLLWLDADEAHYLKANSGRDTK